MSREQDLQNAIMKLIADDLRNAHSIAETDTYKLIIEITRAANADLADALNTNPENRYYVSDSTFDMTTNAINTLNFARIVMQMIFDSGTASVDLVLAISELIEDVIFTIDDMLDDADYLPESIDEIVCLYVEEETD